MGYLFYITGGLLWIIAIHFISDRIVYGPWFEYGDREKSSKLKILLDNHGYIKKTDKNIIWIDFLGVAYIKWNLYMYHIVFEGNDIIRVKRFSHLHEVISNYHNKILKGFK